MPYFVAIRAMERPATIRAGDSHRIDVRVLHEPFATLAEAEEAARRRAEIEQEYPWTAVYVVEAPIWRRAQHLPDPNDHEYHRAHQAIHRAATADPDGRVPAPSDARSAFQPPKASPGPPPPSALPPAGFADPALQRALDALASAGFEAIAQGRSAYYEARPQYAPTVAAMERLLDERKRLGGPPPGLTEQQMADELIRSPADVRGVTQRYELYERDGEYDIGTLSVFELRSGDSIDALIHEVEARRRSALNMNRHEPRSPADSHETKRLFRFQTSRLLAILRVWFWEDGHGERAIAALKPVLGSALPLG